MQGRLEQIWIKLKSGGPMDPRDQARMVAGRGLDGNANQGGRRQITILSRESWDAVTAPLPEAPPPIARRANLLVSGIDLANLRGQVLRVGAHRIRVHGETRPCAQMDEVAAGLRASLGAPWAGGVYGEALDDGEIRVGDVVTVEPDAEV